MNKRFLSTLLTGAIFLAATSMFVSCKDYDDDIKNLQSQIDKAALKSEVDALQTQLTSVSSNASAAMSKAEQAIAAAAAAQKTADAAATKEALEAVKKTAEDAAAAAATAIKAAADAQKTADAAATKEALEAVKKAAEDAAKKAEETYATKAELEAAKKAAAEAAETAKKLAELAQAAADKAQLTAEDAAKIAAAAKELAEAEAKAVAAQAAAEAAQAAADKANEGVANLTSQLENYATLAVTNKLAEDLNGKLDALKAEIEEAAETNLEALALVVAGYGAAIDELYKAVSSVELVASYSGRLDNENEALQFPLGAYINNNDRERGLTLGFIFGKQKFTSKFGDKETESLFEDANEIIEYTEGADIRAKQALLVRVNPVNASFTKDQVKLIDSKGRNLDEIVTIGEPYRYQGLITRGETVESGLWVIPVSVKENTTLKDFNLVTFNEREYYASEEEAKKAGKNFEEDTKVAGNAILYAVAINNTTDEERYVASTYDVAAEYSYFTPETELNFILSATDKKNQKYLAYSWWNNYGPVVHNRWKRQVYNNEGGVPGIQSKDQTTAYTLENPEQKWASLTKEAQEAGWVVPADVAKKETDKLYNTVNDGNDYRYDADFFTIETVGQKISVELPSYLKEKAEYWYITFDFQKNAVESAPSEWEAWQSYRSQIAGIYTMTRAAEKINLVINAATAQGDVIGFRVWAVNYDGSLLDPDGKAFYVKVGEEPERQKLTASANFMAVDATKGMSTTYLYGKDTDKDYTAEKGYNVSIVTPVEGNEFGSLLLHDNNGIAWVSSEDNTNGSVPVYYALLKSDKTLATNWKDIAYIKVGVPGEYLASIKDGATLFVRSIYGDRNDANNIERYQLDIKVTKVMPDAAWTKKYHYDGLFTWKSDYNPVTNVMTIYPKPITSASTVLAPNTIGTDKKFYWNVQDGTAKNLWGALGTIKWAVAADGETIANAGMRFIKDYAASVESSVDIDNYQFQITGLPTNLKSPATGIYTTVWANVAGTATPELASNTAASVLPNAVRSEAPTYPMNLMYTYKGVSLTKTGNNWNTNHDLTVAAWTCNSDFKDAADLLSYTNEYESLLYTEFDESGNKVRDITETDDNLYIAWVQDVKTLAANAEFNKIYKATYRNFKNSRTFDRATFVNKRYTAVTNLSEIFQTTISSSDRVLAQDAGLAYETDIKVFNAKLFGFDDPTTTDEVEKLTISLSGDITTYIKVKDGSTLDNLTFVKTGYNNLANPTVNIKGKLTISGFDAYGKKHTFSVPVVILHADDAVE